MHPGDKILRRGRELPENHADDFQSGITLCGSGPQVLESHQPVPRAEAHCFRSPECLSYGSDLQRTET